MSLHRLWSLLIVCLAGCFTVVHAAVDKIGTLGGPCNTLATSVPCRVVHTLCVDNICRCAPMYRQEKEQCVLDEKGGGSSLGRPCATTSDCSGEGEYCSGYARCTCMSTHVELHGLCRPVIYPGQSGCEDGRQCSKAFPGAVCSNERICQCPDGLTAEGQTCVHCDLPQCFESEASEAVAMALIWLFAASSLVPIVLSDSLPLPLPIPFNMHRTEPRQYRMSHLYWTDQRQQQNLPSSVPPGGICSGDPDCNGYPHAYCSGTCMCRSGSFNAGSTCVESDLPATGTCPANNVYVAEAGSCMISARPGQPCQYSQQCSGNEIGAFCLRQKCQCIYGMTVGVNNRCTFVNTNCTQRGTVWISELGECRPVVPPGARNCTYNKQCTEAYADAMCFLQQCTCPPNMPIPVDGTCGRNCSAGETFSGVLGRCIPTVKPGDQCLYSSQCHALSPGMICDRGSCRCPNSQAWTGSACNAVCPRGYILNNKGLCNPGCRSNQVEFQGSCLEQVNPGQSCVINAQCLGGSTCTAQICICPPGMNSTSGVCKLAEARPLMSCANGELCTGGSFCSNGNCTCPVGTSVLNMQCVTPVTVPPLSPCNPSVRCGGNSFCVAGICSCAQNQQPIQDVCQLPPSVSPGTQCPTGLEQCLGGSTCIGGVCTCPFGTVVRLGECQPIQQVLPGSPCDNNLLRCIGLSVCVSNSCQCPSGMTIQGGTCRLSPTVIAGSSCLNGERCGGNSVCINSICTCPISTINQNGICQSPVSVPPQSSCANQEVCSGGSNCINFVCQCPPGTQIFGAQCIAASGSLGFCTNQIQCGGGSLCDLQRGMCICPSGKLAVGSMCVDSINAIQKSNKDDSLVPAPPLSTCSDDQSCSGGASCRNGFCHCAAGQIPVDGICQFVITEPGTSCANGQTCSGNSYCVEGMCVCSPNERAVGGACTSQPTMVGVGGDCRDLLTQCGFGSVCLMGRCNCPDGWIVRNERCIVKRTAFPGESCVNGEECADGTFCDDRSDRAVCTCYAEDHIVVGKKCVEALRSPPGYPCSNREVCVGGSRCVDGTCQCEQHETIFNRQCVTKPRVLPGGVCGVTDTLCLGRSECDPIRRRCVCPRHFVIREGACETATRVAPGQACRPSLDICQMGSRCVGNVCQCPAGQMPIDQRCAPIPQVMPGGSCARGEICLDRSECRDGRCVCLAGRIIRHDRCILPPRVRPGMSCDAGDICIGASTCLRGICTCEGDNKIIRRDRCVSRSLVRVGYLCHADDTCGGNSACLNGVCTCEKGLVARNDECVVAPEVGPGERCARGEICTGGSTCINFECTCTSGLVKRGDQCMPPAPAAPGMSCDQGERCVGGAACIGGVCRCAGDQVIRNNVCTDPPIDRPLEKNTIIRGGFICNTDDDCTGGAYCQSKVCVCPGKLLMVDGKCRTSTEKAKLSLARPGEACTPQEKCSGDAICVQGSCRCPIGYRLDGIVCKQSPLERVLPGERCTDTLICQNGAFCLDNRCECPIGMVIVGGVCRPAAIVGPLASCANGEICSGNSLCEKGICFCPAETELQDNFCQTVREGKRLRKIEEENRINKSSIMVIAVPTTTKPPSTTSTTDLSLPVARTQSSSATTRSIWTATTIPPTEPEPTATVKGRTTSDRLTTPERVVSIIESVTFPPKISSTTPPGVIFSLKNVVKPGMKCDGDLIVCSNGSSCISGFCQCRVGLLRIDDTCVTPETLTNSQCLSNNQCAPGAECFEGACRCPVGTELTQFGFCMPYATVPPGADCGNGERCGGGSSCVSMTCACPPGRSAIVNNRCVPPSIGFRRRTDSLWLHDGPMLSNLMVDEHVQLINASDTVTLLNEPDNIGLGEPCVPNSSMSCAPKSECLNGICQCSSGLVQLEGLCVKQWAVQKPIVDPGKQCNEDSDFCGGGAECIASLCHCEAGSVPQGATCARLIVGAGRACANDVNCGGGSVCQDGVCQCPPGLVQSDAECVRGFGKAAAPGSFCLYDSAACTGGSFCRSGVCVCATGSTISNGVCVVNTQYVSPGGPCILGDPSMQCSGNSVCAGNTASQFCTCPSGESVQNGQCVSVSQQLTAYPGEPCTATTTQCLGNSFCVGGFCSCTSNQLPVSNQCTTTTTTVFPNYACGPGSICVGNSMCVAGVCQCPPGQSPINNQCQAITITGTVVGNPGTACNIYSSSPITCQGGAVCVQNICVCPGTLVISGDRCVPFAGAANPGDSCATPGVICQGGSTCVTNICRCTYGFMPVGQLCVAVNNPTSTPQPTIILNPGETCDQRCTPSTCLQRCGGGSVCSDNICTCPSGYSAINGACVIATNTQSPPAIPTAYPSQQCVARTLCLGGSTCVLGICRCPLNQTPNPDTRSCGPSGSGAADIVNVPPGSPCSRIGYVCSGGSYCAPDSLCRCPVDQTIVNNACSAISAATSANPGSPCTSTTACLGDSICVRNYCICGQFKLVNTRGRCVNIEQSDTKEVLPGSACPAASAPCQRNSVCENGYCICRPTTINIGGSCVTSSTTGKPIGSSCVDNSECISGALCRNGNCLCPNGYLNQGGRCLPINGVGGNVPIGGQCALDSDCAGGAICSNQICMCPDGRTPSTGGFCYLQQFLQYSVPPGSWCSNEGGITCHGGAECYRNTCSCPFGHVMINLQCSEAPVVLPGRSCNNGELCGGGSVCKGGVCTCPATTTESGQSCQSQIAHAEPCNPSRCRLPDCFCSRDGIQIPGGLRVEDTPQMVVLTFDDAVTDRTINIYKSLFDGRFNNPNGCPIKGTFFISHEWNNYDQTQWLYTNEHEIGVNSITHETLATEPVARWDAEMEGMRDALRTFSSVDGNEVVGVRAPQLSVGGESQFEMMRNRGFIYDNSMSANPGRSGRPYWPQTLDYSIAWNCEVKPCPVRSYPGIWTIPINQFYGYYLPEIEEHKRAAMVRAAMRVDDSPNNVLGMLRENFRRAYETNRAPYVLTLNTDFLTVLPDNGAVSAIEQFLTEILNKSDVYVVTGKQAIDWLRQPTPLSSIRSFGPWTCQRRLRADVQPCESSEPCRYDTRLASGVHSFRTCGSCPAQYPWLYDPTGKKGNARA